jgi:hypothetical protein
VAGDSGIEVDRKRRRVQRIGGGGRYPAEIEVEVFDLAGPIAGETDFGADANCESRLRRVTGEAAGRSAGAGGHGGDFNWNLDRDFDGIAVAVDIGNENLGDAFDDTRRKRETGAGDGAGRLDPADGETPVA